MTNVFAVVGQHRVEPGRLLLLGDDGRYYAYDPAGRPTEVEPSAVWALDADGRAPQPAGAVASARSLSPRPSSGRSGRPFRLALATGSVAGRQAVALVLGVALLLAALATAPAALAHAPALAVATVDASLLAAPAADAPVVGTIPGGTEVELTGVAAGDYLEILAGGRQGWVVVNLLDDGRLDTATASLDTPVRAAPQVDAEVLGVVPPGGTVILTGAAADGYLAASFDGIGGWVEAQALT